MSGRGPIRMPPRGLQACEAMFPCLHDSCLSVHASPRFEHFRRTRVRRGESPRAASRHRRPRRDRLALVFESVTGAAGATSFTPESGRGAPDDELWDLGGVELFDAPCSAHTLRRTKASRRTATTTHPPADLRSRARASTATWTGRCPCVRRWSGRPTRRSRTCTASVTRGPSPPRCRSMLWACRWTWSARLRAPREESAGPAVLHAPLEVRRVADQVDRRPPSPRHGDLVAGAGAPGERGPGAGADGPPGRRAPPPGQGIRA